MPYADPDKKKAYMIQYNKKWYQANKEPLELVRKAVDNKKILRERKRQWLMEALGGRCAVSGEDNAIDLEVYFRDGSKKANKTIFDSSWSQLQNILPDLVILHKDNVSDYFTQPE